MPNSPPPGAMSTLFSQHANRKRPGRRKLADVRCIDLFERREPRAGVLAAVNHVRCAMWWNPDKFVGPAGLLQAYRFIVDSRDRARQERLDDLRDPYRLFRCRTIMNCTESCPKGLSPSRAIEKIRLKMLNVDDDEGGLALHRVPPIR
jgi:Fe-S oxidoreductase